MQFATTKLEGDNMRSQATEEVQQEVWIKLRVLTPDEESFEGVFHLVSDDEVDRDERNVAVNSLLGKALLGTKVGDEISLETKEGPLKLAVLELSANRADIA